MNKIFRPKFFLIFGAILGAILIYNNFLIVSQLLITIRMKSPSEIIFLTHNNTNKSMIIESTKIWVVNNLVAQYSSKVIIEPEPSKWTLEALVLYESTNQAVGFIRSRLKFLVNAREHQFFVDPDDVYAKDTQIIDQLGSQRFIWKLQAHLDLGKLQLDINELVFLVIDFDDYQKLSLMFPQQPDSLHRLLVYHKPNIYKSTKQKKPAVAHCVHQVRGMGDYKLAQNMVSWLRLQKDIGIDRVKLYFNTDFKLGKRLVKEFLTDGFVEIVDYSFEKDELCKYQYKYQSEDPNSYISNYSLKQCKQVFDMYFTSSWPTFHTHEMTATNDCFTNFKYEYEFVTNYDFDELLFPRNEFTYRLDRPRTDINCKLTQPSSVFSNNQANFNFSNFSNIYDYAVRMFETNRGEERPIGALHFQHVLLVDKVDDDFLNSLSRELSENVTSQIVTFSYEGKNLTFNVKKNEYDHRAVEKSSQLIRCLNTNIGKEEILTKWNRVYGIWISVRHGKSIYNTKFTEFVNQHYAELLSKSAKWINVPLDQGFSSHFRDPVDNSFFLGQQYSLSSNFRIDLEYYGFLAHHASKRYSSFLRNFFG